MHARYWKCSYIHCNTPIQVQCAHYTKKPSANNRPGEKEVKGESDMLKKCFGDGHNIYMLF